MRPPDAGCATRHSRRRCTTRTCDLRRRHPPRDRHCKGDRAWSRLHSCRPRSTLWSRRGRCSRSSASVGDTSGRAGNGAWPTWLPERFRSAEPRARASKAVARNVRARLTKLTQGSSLACDARSATGKWRHSAPMAYQSGAPRSMKMGTIASPWRYDAAARHALQPTIPRRPAILRYVSGPVVSPISLGGPVILRYRSLEIDCRIDVMG
jgi:hypothetical protein